MTSQYFVGIGGTGAKCLEAIVHLCAAGLGPDELWVGLVDQDIANGHVVQVEALIDQYNQARKLLRPGDRKLLGESCPLFKTKLSKASPDFVWQPLPREGAKLATDVFAYKILDHKEKALLDCLFTHEELNQPLDLGFRGRPALGAATFIHSERDAAFWQNLVNSIEQVVGDKRLPKLFLAGSVYGGTGASGFPTLARLLARDNASRRDRASRSKENREAVRISVGGTLLLPYFSFKKPTKEQINRHGIMAESSAFLEQSAKALSYYYYLLKEDPVFETLYLLGWSPQIRIAGEAKAGARDQRNPPMLPELYAATAALNFLMAAPEAGGTGRPNTVVNYTSRNDGDTMGWQDLPGITSRQDVYEKLGQFIRFAHAYQGHYSALIEQQRNKKYFLAPWFTENFSKAGVVIESSEVQDAIHKVREFCQSSLTYLADLALTMEREAFSISLYDVAQFARSSETEDGPPWMILSDRDKLSTKNFGSLVRKYTVSSNKKDKDLTHPELSDVLHKMVEKLSGADAGDGVGVFFTRLYAACGY